MGLKNWILLVFVICSCTNDKIQNINIGEEDYFIEISPKEIYLNSSSLKDTITLYGNANKAYRVKTIIEYIDTETIVYQENVDFNKQDKTGQKIIIEGLLIERKNSENKLYVELNKNMVKKKKYELIFIGLLGNSGIGCTIYCN